MTQSQTGAVQADAGDARTVKFCAKCNAETRWYPSGGGRCSRCHDRTRKSWKESKRAQAASRPCDLCGDPVGSTDLRVHRCAICVKAIETYLPIDEAIGKMRARLLRAMRWFDWVRSRDLFDALNLDADNHSTDRNTAYQAITRLVRDGLAERRVLWRVAPSKGGFGGGENSPDYRLTERGRRVADQVRFGLPERRAA